MKRAPKNKQMQIMLTEVEHQTLQDIALECDMSMGQVMREALRCYKDKIDHQNRKLKFYTTAYGRNAQSQISED